MKDTFQKVAPNQPLQIAARTWNGLLEAGQDFARRKLGVEGAPLGGDPLNPAVRVLVRNDTGGDLAAGSILALGTPIISAADYPREVSRQPLFPGDLAAATTDAFAVTLAPIEQNDIGRAVIMGLVSCSVDVTDSTHTYATPKVGDSDKLASASTGPARILWRGSGSSGTKKALCLINDARADTDSVPTIAPAGRSVRPDATDANFSTGSWQDTPVFMRVPSAGIYLINVTATFIDYYTGAGAASALWSFRVYDSTNAAPCENLNSGGTTKAAASLWLSNATSATTASANTVSLSLIYKATSAATLTLQVNGYALSGSPLLNVVYSNLSVAFPTLGDREQTYMTYVLLGQTLPLTALSWTTPGAQSGTVPVGATLARAWAWGAGGGGAGDTGDKAGGGGGGAFSRGDWIAVTAGDTITGTVGAGGANGSSGAGGNGGDTSASLDSIVAKGGTGGSSSAAGTGGTAAASTGTTKYSGGNGGTLPGTPDTGTGGGGGAGSGGAGGIGATGNSSSGGTGGTAGATDGGAGGRGSSNGTPTVASGTGPGGGGGGASLGAGIGGAGADGKIYIEFA